MLLDELYLFARGGTISGLGNERKQCKNCIFGMSLADPKVPNTFCPKFFNIFIYRQQFKYDYKFYNIINNIIFFPKVHDLGDFIH